MKWGARLSWTGWCGVAGVGVLAALALFSGTRWVLRRQVLLAKGEVVHFDIDVMWTSIEGDLPEAVPEDRNGIEADTLRAILKHKADAQLLRSLEALSDSYPQDAFVQTELGRYASAFGPLRAPHRSIGCPPSSYWCSRAASACTRACRSSAGSAPGFSPDPSFTPGSWSKRSPSTGSGGRPSNANSRERTEHGAWPRT